MTVRVRGSRCWLALALAILAGYGSVFAIDDPGQDVVHVTFPKGDASGATLAAGAQFYSNRTYPISRLPKELDGLMYTRRAGNTAAPLMIEAPAGVTVYLLVVDIPASASVETQLAATGWTRLDNAQYAVTPPNNGVLAVYEHVFATAANFRIPGGQVFVAAQHLDVRASNSAKVAQAPELPATTQPAPAQPAPTPLASAAAAAPPPVPTTRTTPTPARGRSGARSPYPSPIRGSSLGTDATPLPGPTTRVASLQATVKCLEVIQTDSGQMLGQSSEVVLTVTRGDTSTAVSAKFVTKVGADTTLALDDALRFIHLTYPNWYVDKAEITFEDKYSTHDGGSIGAALATLFRATVEGITIDPAAAITGDIAANGKIHAIGGVSAKLRGAVAAKCALVALPEENYDQLLDALVYSGPSAISDVQIIGIANLDEAIATVRSDRDVRLASAIRDFAAFRTVMAAGPADYIHSKAAQNRLAEIVKLCSRHLSAKLLLAYAQDKQPATLSTTASLYYTFLATECAAGTLQEPSMQLAYGAAGTIPKKSAQDSLVDLFKLRPKVDPSVLPLVDALSNYLTAFISYDDGHAIIADLQKRRDDVLYAMRKLETDTALMQKMLKEGI